MRIPFAPPFIDDDVIKEVNESLLSGWITSGPKVIALEHEIARITQVKQTLAVNSWTSGAVLVLKWLGLQSGDEVIVPAYTYCATALAVLLVGGKPVMVDVKDDFTIDTEQLTQLITPHTKAIMPVDLGGMPADYPTIKDVITRPENLKKFSASNSIQEKLGRIMIISDSAHSLGAKIGDKTVAQLTDICILSLHAVKNITSAEGGVVCLNLPSEFDNKALKQYLKIMSLNGQTKDSFAKTQLASWQYDVIDVGLKINLPDVNAAIALSQARRYDFILQQRQRVFNRYSSFLKDFSWAITPFANIDKNITLAYHLYPLRIKDFTDNQRNLLIKSLADKEIATNVHYIPMPMLTVFKKLGYRIEDYPKTMALYQNEITLPLYPQLTDEQIDFLLDNLYQAYKTIANK